MSYEGYEQLICANGHYTERDCYDDYYTPCSLCGAKIVDRRSVDQTNDEGEPAIIEIATSEEYQECPTCNHRTITKTATYRFKGENMNYEIQQDNEFPQEWRVEAIDSKTGDCYVTVFGGQDAEIRAREYVAWKQSRIVEKAKAAYTLELDAHSKGYNNAIAYVISAIEGED